MHQFRPSGWILLATVIIGGLGCRSARAAGYFDDKHYPIVTDAIFTADDFILDQAKFWYAIYADVDVDEGLIHDPFYPDMVFRKIKSPGSGRAGTKAAEAQVNALRQEIRDMLRKDSSAWTPTDRELKARFPSFWDSTAIRLSVERLRFQRGLKSKFRAGLERSYRYLPLIDSQLAAEGVPARLKYLPHVESSFYPYAYSKVGAAGMWQFMKSSARRYSVTVGYLVDDRRDPHASSRAAARMLAYNFSLLKSWPLAIVAYNHGPGGLANAVRGTGSRDLGTIIKSYYSNTFGFASKNFYAEFLAASSIAMQADSLFPDLKKMDPLIFQSLVLRKSCGTRYLCTLTGLSPSDLEEYNLGLRPATFRGNTNLPKGFTLRLPQSLDLAAVASQLGLGEAAVAKNSAKPVAPAEVAMAQTQEKVVPQDKVENRDEEEKPAALIPPKPKSKMKIGKGKAGKYAEDRVAVISAAGVPARKPSAPPAPAAAPAAAPTATPTAANPAPVPAAPAAAPEAPAQSNANVTPAPMSSALKEPAPPAAAPMEESHIVDSTLALQASDLDKLAHPMDRFNPAIYNLGYTYADGNLAIQAGTEETLSHYAEWAGVPEAAIRKLNNMRASKDMRLGRRIRIPVAEEKAKEFVRRREEYYRAIEEDFYSSYYVSLTEPLTVEKGMNLWSWAQEREIPFWLLQKHNVGKSLNDLHPGDTLNLPVIETGIRKWGFTRYGNSKEYLSGISRYLKSGKPEAF